MYENTVATRLLFTGTACNTGQKEENNITGDTGSACCQTTLPGNGQPEDLLTVFMVNTVKNEFYGWPVGIS